MQWYYAIDGEQKGPVEEGELTQLAATGTITNETLVWNEGMADWKPYSEAFAAATAIAAGASMGQSLATHVTEADVVLPPGHEACCACNQPFPVDDMISYENQHVCAGCKESFFQRMREGAPMLLGGGGTGQTPNKELLTRAKQALAGNWWASLGTIVLMYMTLGAASFVALIVASPLFVGLIRYFLLKIRGEKHGIADAYSGFAHFGNAWLVGFLAIVYVYVWMLPMMGGVVIMGVLAAVSGPNAALMIPIGIVCYIFVIIMVIRAVYSYMTAFAIAAEYRDISATDCMRRSKRMMTGYRWKLFCLFFRIYWIISLLSVVAGIQLSIFPGPLGITLYVCILIAVMIESLRRLPLLLTAFVAFYDDVRGLGEED